MGTSVWSIFVQVVLGLLLVTEAYSSTSCTVTQTRQVSVTVTYQRTYSSRYYIPCGFWGWTRCPRYRTAYRTGYGVQYSTQQYEVSTDCHHGTCAPDGTCTCDQGYTGDTCEDEIDHCAAEDTACEQVCVNMPSNYSCACNEGFVPHNQTHCQDEDECATGSHDCSYSCNNTYGNFTCGCRMGYDFDLNNRSCEDSNECLHNNGGCQHNCTNIEGSFVCSCADGYTLMPDNVNCTALTTSTIRPTTGPPDTTTQPGSTAQTTDLPAAITTYRAEVILTTIQGRPVIFTEELATPGSQLFVQTATAAQDSINAILRRSPIQDIFIDSKVVAFRQGSVIANIDLFMAKQEEEVSGSYIRDVILTGVQNNTIDNAGKTIGIQADSLQVIQPGEGKVDKSAENGTIAAIVIVLVLLVLALIGVAAFFYRRRRSKLRMDRARTLYVRNRQDNSRLNNISQRPTEAYTNNIYDNPCFEGNATRPQQSPATLQDVAAASKASGGAPALPHRPPSLQKPGNAYQALDGTQKLQNAANAYEAMDGAQKSQNVNGYVGMEGAQKLQKAGNDYEDMDGAQNLKSDLVGNLDKQENPYETCGPTEVTKVRSKEALKDEYGYILPEKKFDPSIYDDIMKD